VRESKKSVLLLSSGLDSTVNAFEALKHGHQIVLALTFDYGQKAAAKEIESARRITEYLQIQHRVIELPWFKDFKTSSLLVEELDVPQGTQVSIDNLNTSAETAKSVWVPNRNGIFINIAAGFAEALGADSIIPGFNAEEAMTFPDNSKEFLAAATQSLWYSTANHVTVGCYTAHLTKSAIVRLGQGLRVPWNLIWPCYFSGDQWCGQCESCLRARRAFKSAGVNIENLFREIS
jgi:7-cyano-7-deazaguanine synthase